MKTNYILEFLTLGCIIEWNCVLEETQMQLGYVLSLENSWLAHTKEQGRKDTEYSMKKVIVSSVPYEGSKRHQLCIKFTGPFFPHKGDVSPAKQLAVKNQFHLCSHDSCHAFVFITESKLSPFWSKLYIIL